MNEKKQKWLAVSLLLLTAMFWGGGFIFQKYTTARMSSSFIVAARFTMASIALAIVCIKKLHLLQEDKGYLLGGAVTGVTMACGNLLQNLGMAYGTDAGKSAFLTAAYCVMVPFLGWLFFRRFPKRNHILSAVFFYKIAQILCRRIIWQGGISFPFPVAAARSRSVHTSPVIEF